MNYIGLDVGGTKIYGAKFSKNFKELNSVKIKTQANQGPETVIKNCIEVIGQLKDEDTQAIGIAWAGMVAADKKTINISPNIKKFEKIWLGKIIEEWFLLPTIIENDARCFALAEQHITFPQSKNLLGLIIGTGIGGGIIINGKSINGFQNIAGEIGHQILENNKTAEDLFAGPALEKVFKKPLEEVIQWKKEKIRKKIDKKIPLLAQWLYNNCLTLNPETIILGGSVGINFWSLFFKEIKQAIRTIAQTHTVLNVQYTLKKSKTKNAGALGAMILIKKSLS